MIPTTFPAIAPATTIGELFGPLAPIAVFGVLGALVVLLALIAVESWTARRRNPAGQGSAMPGKAPAASPLRPAA
jgi:hypothetical protein